ncbi:Helix-turn-helix [Izhakiella capsodis]|uniref:Helix-turn-helix n=1 Tax=Izhakiella capsodis TaxID=1367852 RepID=A0A1I5BSC7_9GAMM|nr:helix-turn-helix domain-containing protein [Izhakiella capsodis]SFN77552.1 Helix-turn-helix [Izhakiella capsodis]
MAKKNIITEEDIQIAKRLKKIWDEKKTLLGLSQEKAACALGFSTQAAISQFLNAKVSINIENLLKFSALLDVEPEEINPSVSPLLDHIRKSSNGNLTSVCEKKEITAEHQELIDVFSALPDDKKEKFMREMKAMKAHYDAYFEQRLRESHGKAS